MGNKKLKGYSDAEAFNIYLGCNRNASEAAREMDTSETSIRRLLKRLGIVDKRKVGRKNKAEEEKFKREFAEREVSAGVHTRCKAEDIVGGGCKRFVITSATNDTKTNKTFFDSLMTYCAHMSARLAVIPLRYKNPTSRDENNVEISWDRSLPLVDVNFMICPELWVMASIKVPATAENPLSGFDGMSKGKSLIIGHPQLQHTNLPVLHGNKPAALWTTGSVSESDYSDTKMGVKASFNHSLSALVIEVEADGSFHIRDLNFDGDGFYDIDKYFSPKSVVAEDDCVDALVTGDTHVGFTDPSVVKATFTDENSIVNTLCPKTIVLHDLFNSYATSHHHNHNIFARFAKFHSGKSCLRTELEETCEFVINNLPKWSEVVVVDSNHNRHLLQFLQHFDGKSDVENLEIYHQLMAMVLRETRMTAGGASYPDPLKLYCDPVFSSAGMNVKFIYGSESFMIHDIELSMHGDIGANGSRGNIKQFAKLATKSISGHSHTSGIDKGARKVGTSTLKRLEYNSGASNWTHTHCLIHKNGCRQMISIVNGKWRL